MADSTSDDLLRDMERALVAIDASKPYRYEPTTSLPALSPQMQAALDAEDEMVASVVKRAREMLDELDALRAHVAERNAAVRERDAARAQLHADDQRAWEALGKPHGTYETTNVQRLCAEVERLRDMLARLCIAVEHSAPGYGVYEDWGDICDGDLLALRERMIEAKALLAKHKETP